MASGSKQNMQHSLNGGIQFINETDSIIHGKGDYGGLKRSRDDAGIDNSDSDNEGASHGHGFGPNDSGFSHSKSGKKTRGRVKIDMKYIENKLRRYTTFSKRKTGIMKKAYELSTLTGTQVMLLVASETGHVYTFATRKLQPMITSDTGKALIQTCLNSPDMGQSSPSQIPPADQRMNPTGYEETEITYSQEEDISPRLTPERIPQEVNIKQELAYGSKSAPSSIAPAYVVPTPQHPAPPPPHQVVNGENPVHMVVAPEAGLAPSSDAVLHTPHYGQTPSQPGREPGGDSKHSTVTMQLPTASYVLPQSGATVPPLPMAPFSIQPNNTVQTITSAISSTPTPVIHSQPVLQHAGSTAGSQGSESVPPPILVSSPSSLPTQQSIAFLPGGVTSASTNQATLVYQTLQGMLCASPQQLGNLPEGFVLGVPQSSGLALPQADGGTGGGTPQYITIPVPVSLAANTTQPQMFAIPMSQSGGPSVNVKKS